MHKVVEVIQGLDDRTAVRFLRFFGQRLFQALRGQDIRSLIPPDVADLEGFQKLQHLSNEVSRTRLNYTHSVSMARALLNHFAQLNGFAELLFDAWSNYRDDSLSGETTLPTGYASGLVTVIGAAGIQIESHGKQVKIPPSDTDLVMSLANATLSQDEAKSLSQPALTCFHPTRVQPEIWNTMLAYVHLSDAMQAVENDSQVRLKDQVGDHHKKKGGATYYIKRGTEITVVPEITGFRFNPCQSRLLWLEDWHCAEFRMQASPEISGFELDAAMNGSVSFYVGPMLIGVVKIWAHISENTDQSASADSYERPGTGAFDAIFVSYSHSDADIVDRLESAYTALGHQYIRDVRVLRSGEEWNPALLGKIEEADLFQLCWSNQSKQSRYVKEEWLHALSLERKHFIRPTFWEEPMPKPPKELGHLHFSRLDLK